MKKKILMLLLLSLAMVQVATAQKTAFAQAVTAYATSKTATAKAVMARQAKAMKKAKTFSGTLYMKAPDKVAIVCAGGKEQLVMNGNTFTMVTAGRKRVASAKTAGQFAAFKAVLQSILGGGKVDIAKVQGVRTATEGSAVVVTMTPAKAKRMMFTSFTLTIDRKTGALETLELKGRGGSTKYTFTGFHFGGAVDDKAFKP